MKQKITVELEVDADVDPAVFVAKVNEQARYATVHIPGRPAVAAVPAKNVTLGEVKFLKTEPATA